MEVLENLKLKRKTICIIFFNKNWQKKRVKTLELVCLTGTQGDKGNPSVMLVELVVSTSSIIYIKKNEKTG